MTKYHPVGCDFYDRLEAYAIRRKPVVVQYHGPDGQTHERTNAILRDLQTRRGAEYLLLDDGTEIRLDRLIRVGEAFPSQSCGPEE